MIQHAHLAIPDIKSNRQVPQAMFPVLSRIRFLPPNPNPFLYLSGGAMLDSGTLNDYFNCRGFPRLKGRIYAVVLAAMSDLVLQAQRPELSSICPTRPM
jgi:hypothetical protein